MKKIWICSLRKKPQTTANVGFSKKKYHLSKWLNIGLFFFFFNSVFPVHAIINCISESGWVGFVVLFFKKLFFRNSFWIITQMKWSLNSNLFHSLKTDLSSAISLRNLKHISPFLFILTFLFLSILLPASNWLTDSTHQDAAPSSCYGSVSIWYVAYKQQNRSTHPSTAACLAAGG